MSSYRRNLEIVLDGEPFKAKTRGDDMAHAERMAARDGFTIGTGAAIAVQQRAAFLAFRRAYPDHPLGKRFGEWIEVLDDLTDLDELEAEADPLDPIPPADSDG
jgi:hypothetical protein